MPIQEQNIVFVASQVMDDVPEGGGAATGNVIVDGEMNNVFEDISDLDRAYGRFNLRKIFLAVRTLSTDLYAGAKTVVTQLPTDAALGYTLFSTNDPFDTREQAANRVEAYLYKGPTWPGYLHENHISGMQTIGVIQRVGTQLPPVGKTLCIVQDEGLAAEKEQYVRVTGVSYVETAFTDNSGDFTRWIVTLTLSDALRFNFTGHSASRFESSYTYTGKARIRDTSVADATRYYGAQRLAEPAAIGDLQLRAASMFTQLVPSAQTETPLVSRTLADDVAPMIAAAAGTITYTAAGAAVGPALRLVLRTGFLPGSLSASVGGVTVTDDGAGNAMSGATVIGTASYATGEILFGANAPSASGTATITYRPAAAAANQAHTLARQVTAENRRLNWVETLAPLPAPRALQLSYMAQGNWYTLRDDGNGNIVGSEPGFGAGTISYVTGALSVTLGALPDVGSQIMLTWGSPAHYAVRAGATADAGATLRLEYVLQTSPVVPGSLTISYPVGGATRTATDAAANGNITGTGVSGTINYATGAVTLDFSTPPDAAANVANAYTWRDGTGLLSGTTATISGGTFTVPGQAPFRNSGSMTFSAATNNGAISCAGYITSGGQIRVAGGRARQPDGNYTVWLDQPVGTFDAATGVVTLTNGVTVALNAYQTISHQWQYQTQSATIGGVSAIAVERDTAAFNPAAVTGETVAPGAVGLTLDLTATVGDPVVATSVLLSVTGSLYVDRGGVLYQDPSVTTGAALVAGSIDYSSGRATLTRWADNTAVGVQVLACLTQYGEWKAIDASFRAPVAPLKPESVTITSTAADGAQITAAADPDGVIAGTYARGAVNYEFGTAWVEFGELVAGVWQPREVLPATIRYNAVGYTYLPLNADILGIDPVRLPPDGRVPIYRPGDVVMILHAADTAPQTVLTGGTVELGRTRIAWVRVIDATGASVTSGYTLDRAAGIVTFADVAGIAMPVTVRHTVGDLRQITDAQISGQLTVARPLTHAFPAGESIVASCLIHGDRRARVSAVWDQATWDGTWADSIKGSEATATLDVIAHPITVTNEGAETERWLLRWTSTTNVELIGERRGLVYSGAFTADIAPINSRTRNTDGTGGTPYLTIPVAANGGGWSAGNVVRINTVGALADIWLARSIQQSDEPLGTGADGCELYALGNIDRP
ncbi:MAG: hypothetical protein ROZ37_21210 [Aromatoleum sp.]|jgi:hypothetical protein|uniref:hypothetical protein n=1 Tax=Aromatoleum sp. TaxID=2307007 RepID=UPI002895918D|nr:hypothetical protein [Aromatoleum sp.]MDT3672845.1 hypothetical protein [Aromatoleum sp.]